MADRSAYQEKIIQRYYENKDSIMIQKLTEMVTDLYLAEGKKRQTIWNRVTKALENLGVTPGKIQQIVEKDDPAFLVRFLESKMK